jgi:plastocyanin
MNRKLVAVVLLTSLAVGGAVLAKVSASNSQVREVHVLVREMAFYVDATGVVNPTLRLSRGERIRFVLKNEDPGYSHNLIAPVLGVSMPLIQHGGSRSVDVTVPDVKGIYSYECGPHSKMMRGNIAIE